MSYEDFPNPGDHHPEVANDPEAMRPAEQETIANLLNAIEEQTQLKRGAVGYSLRLLHKGEHSHHPDAIAQLTHMEKLNNGLASTTNWFISEIPDGLHIYKQTHLMPFRTFGLRSTPQDRIAATLELIRTSYAAEESIDAQSALGLSFVSEKETRHLLDAITVVE
jgi:hypothetical protein